jgi:hypothetical protein
MGNCGILGGAEIGFLLRAGKGASKHVPLDWIGNTLRGRLIRASLERKKYLYLLEEMSYLLVVKSKHGISIRATSIM